MGVCTVKMESRNYERAFTYIIFSFQVARVVLLANEATTTFVVHTRGSNRLTNLFIFGIILTSFFSLFRTLGQNFYEDTKYIIVNTCTVCMLEKAN